MKTIREILDGKMSNAIFAMVHGLQNQSRRSDFEINMATFGYSDANGICYGCAATCTLQEIAQTKLNAKNISGYKIRAEAFHFDAIDLSHFEQWINYLRLSSYVPLAFHMNPNPRVLNDIENIVSNFLIGLKLPHLPILTNADWKSHIFIYEKLAQRLKENGL